MRDLLPVPVPNCYRQINNRVFTGQTRGGSATFVHWPCSHSPKDLILLAPCNQNNQYAALGIQSIPFHGRALSTLSMLLDMTFSGKTDNRR